MKYRSMKRLVERKQEQLDKLWDKEIPTVIGKVTASSKHFPYVQTHPSVYMDEPKEADKRKAMDKQITEEIDTLNVKLNEIEDFIGSIWDPELKEIFELRVYEGMKWPDIAAEIDDGKDRTTYSKKFNNYLKNSRISPISHTEMIN